MVSHREGGSEKVVLPPRAMRLTTRSGTRDVERYFLLFVTDK